MNDERDVGYKQPPKKHQFKSGKSGNPSGRPKDSRNIKTDLVKLMKTRVRVQQDGKRKQISRQEALLLRLYEKAVHGDSRAAHNLLSMVVKLDAVQASQSEAEPERVSKADLQIINDFLRGVSGNDSPAAAT